MYVLTSTPPKSCKGTSVQEARYIPEGLEVPFTSISTEINKLLTYDTQHDRKLVIVDAKTHVAVTARDISKASESEQPREAPFVN